ncbi:MAG: hypothetical protein N2C14_30430, partial [Planctomycetales bacterium]
DVEPLLASPVVEHRVTDGGLEVSVRFKKNSGDESGRVWWIYNRPPDGSPGYLRELIPDKNWVDMTRDKAKGVWTARIELDPKASRVDFFSNHRKTIRRGDQTYPTYLSCPYTRVELRADPKR